MWKRILFCVISVPVFIYSWALFGFTFGRIGVRLIMPLLNGVIFGGGAVGTVAFLVAVVQAVGASAGLVLERRESGEIKQNLMAAVLWWLLAGCGYLGLLALNLVPLELRTR